MAAITKIEITPTRLLLTEPFVISKGALTHARNTVVKIYTDDGFYGIGECCPYRSIHGETLEGTLVIARGIAKQMIGLDPTCIHDLVRLMDVYITGNASIKCAFDIALYDLNAKMVELPLYKYLGGSRKKKIITDNTVSLLSVDEMVAKAVKFKDQGFSILKIKLGSRPSSQDIDRLSAIRKAVGMGIDIRVDANQGWNYQEAKYAVEHMADLRIQHCEEPVHARNIRDQKRLVNSSPIPIMADEAVFNHKDAQMVLAENAADLINIKLGKAGGICNASKVASVAEAADVYCQVGSFSESRLGISALVHFDMVWDCIIYHDLDSPLMMSDDPVIGGMKYSDGWEVTVDDSPGHGADYDQTFLDMFETAVIN